MTIIKVKHHRSKIKKVRVNKELGKYLAYEQY